MNKCVHCGKELPPLNAVDARNILEELKRIPGFMENLGKNAAEAYIKSGKLKI